MLESKPTTRELWIVVSTFVFAAAIYRYAFLPIDWMFGLDRAADSLGLEDIEVGRWFTGWTVGDGQAFAVIATDPLGLDEGWNLGFPAYRYGRAGFGWLSWVASLGQSEWVPYGMAIIGVLTLTGIFLLAARLRTHFGRRAWILALNPAVLIGFASDTAEPLGILALSLAMATGSWWVAAGLGVIRPSFAVALLSRWRLLLVAMAAAIALGGLLILRFGLFVDQYTGNLTFPLTGYLVEPSLHSVGLAIAAATTIAIGIKHNDWSWIGSGIFVLSFAEFVLADADDAFRAAGMLYVLWAFGPGYSVSTQRRRVGRRNRGLRITAN